MNRWKPELPPTRPLPAWRTPLRWLRRGGLLAAASALSLLGAQQAAAQSCTPDTIYDALVSSFHQTAALRVDSTWAGWGEQMDEGGNALSPQDLAADGTKYVGLPEVLLVTTGSSSTNHQTVALTTGGLYVWGTRGRVVSTTHTPTNTSNAQKIVIGGTGSANLPAGVNPADVTQLFASNNLLALVTQNGQAWVLTALAGGYTSNGTATAANTQWHRVSTAGGPLANVVALRGQVNSVSGGALMALTSDGKAYTWGPTTYLGDGTAASGRTRATEMTLPHQSTPNPVTGNSLPKMIGVTGTTSGNTYYVVYQNGQLFGMGYNHRKQVGDGTTTTQTGWKPVLNPDKANQPFDNVRFISVQEHNGSSNVLAAASLITDDDLLYTWGENDSQNMLDRTGYGSGNAGYCTSASGCDPAQPYNFYTRGDRARTAELGGHTLVYLPENSPRFCYSGHKISGSMGDGTSSSATGAFNCTDTPAINICGSTAITADDDAFAPLVTPTAPVTAGNVLGNDRFRGDPITDISKITLAVQTPATPQNPGDPVPTLDPTTGNVTVPAGTPPGTYTIEYKICDKDYPTGPTAICDTATATVTVQAPAIVASNDVDSTTSGTPVTTDVLGNDSGNSPRNPASVTVGGGKSATTTGGGTVTVNPDGTITYTPADGFQGTDTYTYQVCLTAYPTVCDTAVVTIAVGEAPAIASYPDTGTTAPSTPVTTDVLGNDVPVGGTLDPATVTVATAPANGTITGVDPATGRITYLPNPGFTGTDTYTYRVCLAAPNGTVCDDTTVTIVVGDAANPGIAATPDFDSTAPGTPVTTPVVGNDTPVGGTLDPGTVTVTGGPSHGTAVPNPDGSITYTPTDPDFVGTDTYTYRVCLAAPNGTVCAETTVTITVGNPAITATPDSGTTAPGTPVTTPVLDNDSPLGGELDPSSVRVIDGPANGTVTVDPLTGKITYTPNDGFAGEDSFTYQVCLKEPGIVCASTTVTIRVSSAAVTPVPTVGEWALLLLMAGLGGLGATRLRRRG